MTTTSNPLHGKDDHNCQNNTQNNSTERSKATDPSNIRDRGELDQSIDHSRDERLVSLIQPTMNVAQE